jgi:glycosyltransferase involved in cell wall biosynthesis
MQSLVAPSKLYPAMATGRPIAAICPANSYLNGLLATAGCGAAFRNGEAQQLADFIRGLLDDCDRAVHMGNAGRQYLKAHFTPTIISKQYLKVIKSASGQR